VYNRGPIRLGVLNRLEWHCWGSKKGFLFGKSNLCLEGKKKTKKNNTQVSVEAGRVVGGGVEHGYQ